MAKTIIIGAGDCGTRTAFALREFGYSGSIILVNGEDLLPYERPSLSKPDGTGNVYKPIVDEALYEEKQISLLSGKTATSIDPQAKTVVLNDGSVLNYSQLLLATGARPRPWPGDSEGYALLMRSHSDAANIYAKAQSGQRAVIIGAGLIGLELAAELHRRNVLVTVIEMAPVAMGRAVPAALSGMIVALHVENGIDVRLGCAVREICNDKVILSDGQSLHADLCVAAIGVIPNVELAERAGLAVGNGISINASLQTSDPAIFAAGDCADMDHPRYGRFRCETWRNAIDQGNAAARAIMGEAQPFETVPWFWSDQFDLGLQVVGRVPQSGRDVTRDLGNNAMLIFHLDDSGQLQATSGLGNGNSVAKHIKLAEMLIQKASHPDPDALADPTVNLKRLLKA